MGNLLEISVTGFILTSGSEAQAWGPAIWVLTGALQMQMHSQVGTTVPEHLFASPSTQLTPTHLQYSPPSGSQYLPQPLPLPSLLSLMLLLLLLSWGEKCRMKE